MAQFMNQGMSGMGSDGGCRLQFVQPQPRPAPMQLALQASPRRSNERATVPPMPLSLMGSTGQQSLAQLSTKVKNKAGPMALEDRTPEPKDKPDAAAKGEGGGEAATEPESGTKAPEVKGGGGIQELAARIMAGREMVKSSRAEACGNVLCIR